MYRSMTILLAVLVACVNSRHLYKEDSRSPLLLVEDDGNLRVYEKKDISDQPQPLYEEYSPRVRRQAQGSMNTNPDGSSNVGVKIPIAGDDKNRFSALGSVGGATEDGGYKAAGGGLAWDNVKGHGATLTGQHIPGFGDQLTAAAKMNLHHSDKHDVTASAFATRNFPSNPVVPNFDTYGGKVGYTYDDKIGASLGMAQTDLFKKTDYSAMGNLNLFKTPTSSLDFSAGMSKSVSPYIPSSSWQPSAGMSFTKWF